MIWISPGPEMQRIPERTTEQAQKRKARSIMCAFISTFSNFKPRLGIPSERRDQFSVSTKGDEEGPSFCSVGQSLEDPTRSVGGNPLDDKTDGGTC
jgi:hypothetical protein